MPPQGESYQYIQIKDFKPGIADNPGAGYPPGQAQRNLTYRCIANRAGALVPLPAAGPGPIVNKEASTAAIVGIYLPPIQVVPNAGAAIIRYPPHELFVGVEILNGGNRYHRLYRYRQAESGSPYDVVKSIAVADGTPVTDPTPGGFTPSGMWFGSTRSNRASPTNTGSGAPVVIAQWQHSPGLMYLAEIPNDQALTSNAYDIYLNNAFLNGFVCHQGRIVFQRITVFDHLVNASAVMGENISWTAINDVTTANIPSQDIVFVSENPSGFAFLFSMSANEMFAVKNATGGVYVTGAMEQAVIVSLPLVTGSDIQHTPAASSLGVVYGSRLSGIWAWSHGDNCNLISPMMDPMFWTLQTPPTGMFAAGKDDFAGNLYQFARSDDWILTSNNWLYDTQIQSWWRLEDPSLMQFRWMTANFRYIYGSTSWFQGNDNVYQPSGTPIRMYDRQVPNNSFSWQSQPLWETIDSLVDIREIVVRAKGHGTINISLTGETSSVVAIPLTVSSDLPVLLRTPVRLQDSNIAVRIQSDSDFSVSPAAAPTVYECNLGYVSMQKERTS